MYDQSSDLGTCRQINESLNSLICYHHLNQNYDKKMYFCLLFALHYYIIDEMALYRFFTGTAVSAKTQKHDVFLKPTVPGKKSN